MVSGCSSAVECADPCADPCANCRSYGIDSTGFRSNMKAIAGVIFSIVLAGGCN